MKALILDAHSRASVGAIHSLARQKVEVDVAAEGPCLAFGSRRVSNRFEQPRAEPTGFFLEWLRRIDCQSQYSMILPSSEMSLQPFLDLTESDPLRQKAVLPSNHSLRVALNKQLTLEKAAELRIPFPQTKLLHPGEAVADCDSYPVVLKPISSLVRKNGLFKGLRPCIARNDFERKEHLRFLLQYGKVLQQEHVAGRGMGVEMLYRRGRLVWSFAHERLHEGGDEVGLGGGSSYRRSIVPTAEMMRHSKNLLDALGWHGVAQVEFKVAEDGRFWLMEINPRLWGSLSLAIHSGVDFPCGLLSIAVGGRPTTQPVYKVHHYTRLLTADLNWLWASLAHRLDRGTCLELLKLLRPLAGIESWDYFDLKDLKVLFNDFRNFLSEKLQSARKLVSTRRRRQLAWRLHALNLRRFVANARKAHKLLFLCHGNICRSPVAESLAKQLYPQSQVRSAGFHSITLRGSPDHVRKVARKYSVDLSGWSSTRVDPAMVGEADAVLLHDMRDYVSFCEQFPEHRDKLLFLGMFADKPALEIKDPYQASTKETAQILRQISGAVKGLEKKLHLGTVYR